MKKIFLFTLVGLAGLQLRAQNIDKIITKEYTDHLIKTLSSDEMQGRATFSPGIDKAATFIETEFKKIGLKPLTGATGFRQSFYKYQIKKLSTSVKIDGKEIDPVSVMIAGVTTESVSINKGNAEIIKLDVNKPFVEQFRASLTSKKNQLVLVDAKFAENFKRYKNYIDRPATLDEKDVNAAETATQVFVLGVDAASDFSAEAKSKVDKMPLFNVAGMIPGKSKAKELVVFSGHYDHLGILKNTEGDSIANGADDDASGTTAMIALAKYYKTLNNNERTLIFVAFTAEEIGGFGARYFSEKLNPDEVVAMFNIEMIGKDSKFGKNSAFITGYDKSDFGKILQKNLAGTEFTFYPDPYPQQNLFYRSDNATLAALGVPAHTISTDQIDVDKFYHTIKDEYSTLDVENILSTIKAIAKSAITIVNGKDTPTRIPKLKQ
ncbi:M20/M25/M40 family metallo-hydrolase [Pedobacter punctiformis]|uniref:M20/M25/M40 family metallo-hydrolase n=1 Tax=Pedobacter punctiformis TaxID=3004097 RepID=A0ABT4L5W8_9SPHI|nr:M20/M25/M40 family metallo-hydrolase [Pedobacter sp. HCMS5-2]MCZ4243298.1 M20/M25/M40 family metallo-hydrolase [Pedobacter sp. HCMS5-2]